MHVKRTNGSMALGLDAFIEIWKNLPSFTWMARTAEIRPIHFILSIAYHAFAKIRPLLPRKNRACEASPYCEMKEKQ